MWLMILFFSFVNCNLYPQERCDKNECFLQLQSFRNESCLIYNTKVCLQSMSNFTQEPVNKLESEEDAKFTGFIAPYSAEVYIRSKFRYFSAINISFTVHKEGVNALAIKIIGPNRTLCRIFDFYSPGRFFSLPVTFFYDCFWNLAESQFQYVQVEMISLPSNEQLAYYVYIPDPTLIKTSCDWQPVIMVFCGKLADGIVKIKFSRAPQEFNISSYAVELVEKSSNKISLTIQSNQKSDMIATEFLSVPYGNYTVIVKPLIWNQNICAGAELGVFQVGNSKPALDILTVICICIIVVFIVCSLAVYKFCHLSIRFKLNVKRALLVYSYDCPQHEECAKATINFLTQKSHLEVSTIYGTGLDTMEYVKEECRKADIIIFLISEGLLVTLNPEDPRQIKVGPCCWLKRLPDAAWHIFDELDYSQEWHTKKICKIRFKYASELKIPKGINRYTGKCFDFPKEFHSFMCFVHDSHSTVPCTNIHLPSYDDFNCSEVGKQLLDRIGAVQKAVDQNTHIRFKDEPMNKIQCSEGARKSSSPSFYVNSKDSKNPSSSLLNEVENGENCPFLNSSISGSDEEVTKPDFEEEFTKSDSDEEVTKSDSGEEETKSDCDEEVAKSDSDEEITESDSDEEVAKFEEIFDSMFKVNGCN